MKLYHLLVISILVHTSLCTAAYNLRPREKRKPLHSKCMRPKKSMRFTQVTTPEPSERLLPTSPSSSDSDISSPATPTSPSSASESSLPTSPSSPIKPGRENVLFDGVEPLTFRSHTFQDNEYTIEERNILYQAINKVLEEEETNRIIMQQEFTLRLKRTILPKKNIKDRPKFGRRLERQAQNFFDELEIEKQKKRAAELQALAADIHTYEQQYGTL